MVLSSGFEVQWNLAIETAPSVESETTAPLLECMLALGMLLVQSAFKLVSSIHVRKFLRVIFPPSFGIFSSFLFMVWIGHESLIPFAFVFFHLFRIFLGPFFPRSDHLLSSFRIKVVRFISRLSGPFSWFFWIGGFKPEIFQSTSFQFFGRTRHGVILP